MILVLMGVSGSGKSTVGSLLSRSLGFELIEGDEYHSPESIEKMRSGRPLTDADRWPWLTRLADLMADLAKQGRDAVFTCSALKKIYREKLASHNPEVRFVYLKGTETQIRERLKRRKEHFMPPALLKDQFAVLEEPEDAIVVNAADEPEDIVAQIRSEIAR